MNGKGMLSEVWYLSAVNEVVIPKPIKSCIFYERLQLAERWKC